MVKIYLIANFRDNKQLNELYKRQTPGNKGIWEDIYLTDDKSKADFFIVLNEAREKIPDMKRTIFFAREPKYAPGHRTMRNIKEAYKVCNFNTCYMFARWNLNKSYDELVNMEPPKKEELVSCIVSGKRMLSGQRRRLEFILEFCNRYPKVLHLYGKVNKDKKFINHITGGIDKWAKDEGLAKFKFSFAFENGRQENYFSEKFVDPILMWTVPVYWGCPNIGKFFPWHSYIHVNIFSKFHKLNDEVDQLYQLLQLGGVNWEEKYIPVLRESRDLILNKYNFWPTLYKLLDTGKVL